MPLPPQTTHFETYARIAVVSLLVLGTFLVVQPFLAAILFAVILCLSTWPAYISLRDRWHGRSSLAALVLVFALLLAIALPVALAAQSLIVHSADIVDLFRGLLERRDSIQLPEFVS